jgi:CRISPR type III-A-associated RAMP protein Csm4
MGPWRFGGGEGTRNDRVDTLFRSDRLYSAVTSAMRHLGYMEEWLDATARASSPQVALSSLFPFQGDTLFVTPPRTLWPPPPAQVTSPSPVFLSKIRWDAARFVPAIVVDSLLSGRPILAEHWIPDPESGCLVRRDRAATSPFRVVTRNRAAVDRLSPGSIRVESFACVEFEPGAGLWSVARFAGQPAREQWSGRIQSAFRLLADTGFGAGRVIGWGQTAEPQFQPGSWPNLLLPRSGKATSANHNDGAPRSYWLLSLYSPAATDLLDWSGGDYQVVTRCGDEKKASRMIAEGSVLTGTREPTGAAPDVAIDGHSHPIYRAGFAVAVRLPEPAEQDIRPVEEPSDIEAPEAKPCPETEPSPAANLGPQEYVTEPQKSEAPQPEPSADALAEEPSPSEEPHAPAEAPAQELNPEDQHAPEEPYVPGEPDSQEGPDEL